MVIQFDFNLLYAANSMPPDHWQLTSELRVKWIMDRHVARIAGIMPAALLAGP